MALLFALFIGVTPVFAQESDCSDFRTGSFYIRPTDELPISYRIVRTTTEQIETILGSPKGVVKEKNRKPQYGIIEWEGACSYRIKFDDAKTELSETQLLINANNGVLIELLTREKDCFKFRSTFLNGEETISFIGTQCKEK